MFGSPPRFVTIRIFARTELLGFGERRGECFVTILIFARTEHYTYV